MQPPVAQTGRVLWTLAAIQILCAIGFGVDLVLEVARPGAWRKLGSAEVLHLLAEAFMLGLILFGLALTRSAIRTLRHERNRLRDQLSSLRGEFDRVLQARFAEWNLTPAQRDVALLTLRGLRLKEIAAARGSAEGTVKAHLNAVFRAANVRTRAELVGLFMDEFLDVGAGSCPPSAP